MEALLEQLAAVEDRYRELSLTIIDPDVIADQDAYRVAIRDFKQIEPVVERVRAYRAITDALNEARADTTSEDEELRAMAAAEVTRLESERVEMRRALQEALVPDDPSDGQIGRAHV